MNTQAFTTPRIDGLDLARALAIFGMIIVNYVGTLHLNYTGAHEPVWLRLLNTTGQMSLSIYLAHIVVGLGILEELGMLYAQTLAFALAYSLLFIVLSVVFANLWRLKWQRGPLEWLMRRLS